MHRKRSHCAWETFGLATVRFREAKELDGETLNKKVFPELAARLAEAGEVYVAYDYASHFAHYLMWEHHELWQRTEQEALITDDLKARFYLDRT